jgi:hypothetical protein
MEIVGKTSDGKPVVSGIAELYYRDGLPLSIVFDQLIQKGLQPSFPHLYTELEANGMGRDRILHLLSEHLVDPYGKAYRDVVISRL